MKKLLVILSILLTTSAYAYKIGTPEYNEFYSAVYSEAIKEDYTTKEAACFAKCLAGKVTDAVLESDSNSLLNAMAFKCGFVCGAE